MRALRRTLPALMAAMLVAPAWPALAQDKRPRDSGGVKMDLSDWHSMPTHEFMLNIGDLPGVEPVSAQRRTRHTSYPHQRLWFDDRSFIFVEHINVRVYRQRVTHRFQSLELAEEFAERYWSHVDEPFAVEDKRKIYIFRKRGGWVLATRGGHSGRLCFIARLGFLSDPRKGPLGSQERYDTSVFFRDCSGKRSLDAVVTWLEGARIVGPR